MPRLRICVTVRLTQSTQNETCAFPAFQRKHCHRNQSLSQLSRRAWAKMNFYRGMHNFLMHGQLFPHALRC